MKWFKVEFDLGIDEGTQFPTDGYDFFKWLASREPSSFVSGLVVRRVEEAK